MTFSEGGVLASAVPEAAPGPHWPDKGHVRTAAAPSEMIPRATVALDFHQDEAGLHRDIRRVCHDLLPAYRGVDANALAVSTISGGITNILLKVVPPHGVAEPVTVRIFGDNTDVFIDRVREIKALRCLNAAGFGAKVLGLFDNGRIEAFLHGKTLGDDDLADPTMVSRIAPLLRRFHACQVPTEGGVEPQLFPILRRWHSMAGQLKFEDLAKDQAYRAIDVAALGHEIGELEAALGPLGAPTVYCHNDVLSGNLMFDGSTGTMHIIDFEYGCYGYRGFDLGNHFNEYAGFECDYDKYPSREALMSFFQQHLDSPHARAQAQMSFFRQYLAAGGEGGGEPGEGELEALFVETNAFSLASHVYWALWALIQAKYSPIDFDYLGYFHLRMAEYRRRKAEVLALVAGADHSYTVA